MGKKSKKTKRKSELKVIFFIILMAAALFIVSTYAWFSTQRNVSITNLQGIVEVAEGLEISLDAKIWANEIKLGEDMHIIRNAYNGNNNIYPKELLPVSTLGKVSSNITDLKMIRGKVTNSTQLSEIVSIDEGLAADDDSSKHDSEDPKYPGYFAFDIFLKNSSKQDEDFDVLQLNSDSSLHISEGGNDTVGLQNTARIAFARYGTGDVTGTDPNTNEKIRSGVSGVNAKQDIILKETGAVTGGDTVYITDVAIWEPNANDHVEYIVYNNNSIKWAAGSAYERNYAIKTLENGTKGFDVNTQIPTFALKDTVANTNTVINDIYVWDGTEASLEEQVVLQTTKTAEDDYTVKEGVENLISTKDGSKSTPFSIPPNCVVRLRVYVWLEGQDVDCINYASHGGGITVNIGLVKGEDPEADNT